LRITATLLLAAALAGCATLAVSASSMSLEEKVGQLFVFVAPGNFMNEGSPKYAELLRQVRENHVGGIHWATWTNVFEGAFLTRRLQEAARVPLLVSSDLEAGIGMRFADTTYWPWPMAVAAAGDPDLARREGEILGEEARAVGINQVYAPVADVNVNPDNPVINVRSFGEDPEEVARYVAAFVRGVESRGVIATAKHFPGHGDTRTDSHRSLPVLSVSRERLERVELVPFRAAIAAGAGAVMTAHLSIPALDDEPAPVRPGGVADNPYTRDPGEATRNATLPASLSPRITEGLLRNELGFRGIVVTDALDMGGIVDHFDPGEAAVRAILAGADQVLKSTNTDAAIAGVKQAVQSGRISRERLDLSVRRILAAKARAGEPLPEWDRIFRVVDSPAHRAVAEEIARRSVTLVRERPGALPLDRKAKLFELVVADADRSVGMDLNRALKVRMDGSVEMALLDSRSSDAEISAALENAARADVVVLALFVRFQSGRGSIALAPPLKAAAEKLLASGARVVAVSFGSPYVLREVPALDTYLCAWGAQTDMQVAAARALLGETAITGRLPITIPDLAPRGSGIQKPAGGA
jgi:beta-N-acetylhexosaminidase